MTECMRISQVNEEINRKRNELNKRVLEGIDEKVIVLSQELDQLINIYTRYQIELIKK
ncbi:aspartyl-phosphate phosphatase Spo0E family protein [Tissierella creatinini]|nr:aspartyl-phosphate phosphatase Spo0E family protein [Tissierella creatinini]TJX62487.1 aspartyl-phosphate phosphatase Spo0E family protein [Soehngenia saccharolytica]